MLVLLSSLSLSALVTQLRFAVAGLIATGVNYAAFFLLLGLLGVGSLAAVAAAFFLSTSVNFMLQKFWTYRAHCSTMPGAQLLAYIAMAVLLMFLNNALFYLFTSLAHLNYLESQALLTAAVSIAGYYLTKLIFTARLALSR